MLLASGIWARLLAAGKYPSRGLAGVLMQREVFETASRVPGLFDGGRPHLLAFWRALLSAASEQPCRYFGVLRGNYAGEAPSFSLEALAAHQMDWHALCEKDGMLCIVESRRLQDFDFFVRSVMDYGVTHALYLQPGKGWNYAWYRDNAGMVHIMHPKTHDYSTNWITFYY